MRGPMNPFDPVPERYRGVWKRTLLQTPHSRDTETTVFWLQTARWHADIRIPSGRPDFTGICSLADCSPGQLDWFAGQQGFAGFTQVDASAAKDICQWHRIIDVQPPSPTPDAGRMTFGLDHLLEEGVHADYLEHWTLVPASTGKMCVLEGRTSKGEPEEIRRLLFLAGDYLMRVQDRSAPWPSSANATVGFDDAGFEHEKRLLDCEISFGRRSRDGWTIMHSTKPWLEGSSVVLASLPFSAPLGAVLTDHGGCYWEVVEQAC